MEITFASPELAALANDDRKATKAFGRDGAKKLRRRLDDLAAAPTLSEAYQLPGKFEALKGNLAGRYSLRLDGGRRMVLEPAHEPPPTLREGTIDLGHVTRIRIIALENYHD